MERVFHKKVGRQKRQKEARKGGKEEGREGTGSEAEVKTKVDWGGGGDEP